MAKLFTIAGTSVLNGVRTYRFASGNVKTRIGVLRRNEHTDIQLLELPNPMEKSDAIQWLNSQGIDATVPVTGRRKIELTPEEIAQMEEEHRWAMKQRELAEAAQLAQDADWINRIGENDPMDDFNYVGSKHHY
jgi:hypothetical protein